MIHEIWFGYFWPSLQGNGPEDIISYLIIGGGVTLIGKKLLKEWREHKAKVAAEHDAIHRKLNHVIEHSPDIPNCVPGLPDHLQPKGAIPRPKDSTHV